MRPWRVCLATGGHSTVEVLTLGWVRRGCGAEPPGVASNRADVPRRAMLGGWRPRWTAGPAVGTEGPTAVLQLGRAAPRSLMEPPSAEREKNMWRNEGVQFGSSFNLSDQH